MSLLFNLLRIRHIIAALLAIALSASMAGAEEVVTKLNQGDGTASAWTVHFSTSGCEEECGIAELSCDPQRNISFTLDDVPGSEAAKLVGEDRQLTTLAMAGSSYPLSIRQLTLSEMTGTWWITGYVQADHLEFYKDIATVETFAAAFGSRSVKLPVTQDVKTWAADCAK